MKTKNRLLQVSRLCCIIEAYGDFYDASLNAECSKHNLDYDGAENLSLLCNFVAKTFALPKETTPDYFLSKQETYIDNAIEAYCLYKKKLAFCLNLGLDLHSVDALCKHVYYRVPDSVGKMILLRVIPTYFLEIPYIMKAYLAYKGGFISRLEIESYHWIEFFSEKKVNRSILKRIILAVRQIETLYNEIEDKIDNRSLKKLLNK